VKINVYLAVVLLLVLAGVFGGISLIVGTINTDGMPDFIVVFVNGLKYVFLTSAVAPFFVMIRNVYGYFTNKAANPNSEMQYEGAKLLKTWLIYEGYIKGIGILVVTFAAGTKYAPYSYMISGSLAFIVDLVRKSLSDIATGRNAPV
jgi:hypothetical protein